MKQFLLVYLGLKKHHIGPTLGATDLVFGRHNGVDGVGDVRANAGEVCASVEEQVECLLALATDPGVLANGWSGWRPWL